MKILSVGNSFSQDTQHFLHQIAKSVGIDLCCENLYIPGCSLEYHCDCFTNNKKEYAYEINGDIANSHLVTLDEVLAHNDFDFITIQQASHFSGKPDTYVPYISELVKHIKSLSPVAKIIFHETWAYEHNSPHWAFPKYANSQAEMFRRIVDCANLASKLLNNCPIIKTGEMIQYLREKGGFGGLNGQKSINRDSFHLSLNYGRFAAGLLWLNFFTNADVTKVSFIPDDPGEQIEINIIESIKKCVSDYIKETNQE